MSMKQQYVEQLVSQMGQLRRLFESHAQELCQAPGATLMQYSALKYLSKHGQCSVGELGDFLQLSKSSTTQLVERLVKAGYVNRFTSPTDRRIVHVAITNEGLVKMTELKQSFVKKMSRSFETVPESDMQQLLRIQQLLIDILQTQ